MSNYFDWFRTIKSSFKTFRWNTDRKVIVGMWVLSFMFGIFMMAVKSNG